GTPRGGAWTPRGPAGDVTRRRVAASPAVGPGLIPAVALGRIRPAGPGPTLALAPTRPAGPDPTPTPGPTWWTWARTTPPHRPQSRPRTPTPRRPSQTRRRRSTAPPPVVVGMDTMTRDRSSR